MSGWPRGALGGCFWISPRSSRSSSGLRSSSVDEGLQLEVRHLQQLDRLLQLRRHHQGLALAEFESLVQRHGARSARHRLKSAPR